MFSSNSNLLILFCIFIHQILVNGDAKNRNTVEFQHQRIQIESHSRDYKSGPVGGTYTLSIHDEILLSLEDPGENHIWQWGMTSVEMGKYCRLTKIYSKGSSVSMKCGNDEGVYIAFATNVAVTDIDANLKSFLPEKLQSPSGSQSTADEGDDTVTSLTCSEGLPCIDVFHISWNGSAQRLYENTMLSANPKLLQSFPIKIISTEYCFLWAYKIENIGKVGYIDTEAEPFDTDGSYISYRIRVWVAESNAMTEAERAHDFPQAEYSGVLTRRFKTKGLEPCFRFSHQSIEMLTPEPTYIYDPDGEGLFWVMDFKVHTRRIVSTLSDLSLTIGSRQHIALYGCFIAATRVILDPRQFTFLGTHRNDIQKINIDHSRMPLVMKRFMKSLKHIFGHHVRYIGHPWDYESAAHRKDMQVFQNPCMTLEFGFAVRSVSYVAQNWLSLGMDDVSQISLPGLHDGDFGPSQDKAGVPGQKADVDQSVSSEFIDAYDFAFTPTHLVVLTAQAHIILYPTSIVYKGFGVIRNVQSYRPSALVQRRWCATTGTPKEHNMVVPSFSANGNFIIIQIMPVETTATMWLQTPDHACLKRLVKPTDHMKNESDANSRDLTKEHERRMDEQYKLEVCIHRKEIPKAPSKVDDESPNKLEEMDEAKKNDECKSIFTHDKDDDEISLSDLRNNLDSKLKYWFSGQALLKESDPHFAFSKEDDTTNFMKDVDESDFNRHIFYEVDQKGHKIIDTFEENGLELNTQDSVSGKRFFFWLHDVEFTAVERCFMQAIEFKSETIKKSEFSMAIINVVTLDQPVKLQETNDKEKLETDYLFSGVLIVRPNLNIKDVSDSKNQTNGTVTTGRMAGTIKTFTTNTAQSSYVIHIDYLKEPVGQDVLIYATFDGTHARPLTYCSKITTMTTSGQSVVTETRVRFTGQHPSSKPGGSKGIGILKPDLIMTEHGVVSVLWRKANLSEMEGQNSEQKDNYPQAIIIGSIIVPEPLRLVMPFKGSSYIFQRVTADAQVVYGEYTLQRWQDDGDPNQPKNNTASPKKAEDESKSQNVMPNLIDIKTTRFLAVPFESLVGNMDTAPDKNATKGSNNNASTSHKPSNEICPFADFVVHYLPFDFAEVEYRTRITAELVYLGSSLPLEADILVEFDDTHGIAVDIHSGTEENKHQTLIRKTVDIHTFLTPAALHKMFKYPESHEDTDEIKEEIIIFSITMRPSILNMHCPRKLFFKTIQINVGCNPFTTMRFIPEAIGLEKVPFVRSSSHKDRENFWTLTNNGEEDYEVTIPRSKINFSQRQVLECVGEVAGRRGYCKVPKKYSRLFKENMYAIHFSKSVVPKFEQFLTHHVRRVTGNVFLYKVAGKKGKMYTNTSLLDSRCHNLGPFCAPVDKSCGSLLNTSELHNLQEFPWTATFFRKQYDLDPHTDIYRHFRDCYNPFRRTADEDLVRIERDLPSKMHQERYWIFNSTNYNAFHFKKHRNMIFLIRAAVVNTNENGFTFCQRLETFFLLHMVGVTPARRPLHWTLYLSLLALLLFIVIICYFYFAFSSKWKSEVATRRIREEEEKEQREMDAKRFNEQRSKAAIDADTGAPVTFAKWASRLRDLAKDEENEEEEITPGKLVK